MYFTIIYYKMIKLYQHNDYDKINVIVLKY